MRLKNNSQRTIHLGGTVRIVPGGEAVLAPDAQHLAESPLVKAYLTDRTLTLVDDKAKAKLTADKPKARDAA